MMSMVDDAQDVFNGAIVKALRVMLTPRTDRIVKNRKKLGQAYDDNVKDLAGEMGEELYWKSQQTAAAGNRAAPKKFVTEDEKTILRGEKKRDLTGAFMPPGMKSL